MKKIKENKGITLISLVITVIIILILAGVSISVITGDNGLVGKAGESSKSYENARYNEDYSINSYLQQIPVAVKGITLNKTSTTIGQGDSETLIATIEPSDASNKEVEWSTSDESVATVDENGNVTAIASSGNAIITVKTKDGGFTASCTVSATSCFAKGTKITVADGLTKNIEDIKEGDCVLTFNHEAGVYEFQEVYLAWKGEKAGKAFTLHFDNGNSVSIVGKHDLFEKESLKYVTISVENTEDFVGKHFYSVADGKYVELLSVTVEQEEVEYYSIYTKYNLNCIANGMLSVPDDTDYYLNIYEFYEDLGIDNNKLAYDIEKYGIWEYNEKYNYTIDEYNYMKINYSNIAVSKNLISWEELCSISNEYLEGK